MGISLLDCISDDRARLETKIYDKITKSARDLVKTALDLEHTYGIPIINKRVSVTPISLVGADFGSDEYVRLAGVLERAANELGINFIGGFGALVQKGMTRGASALIEAIPEALATTTKVCWRISTNGTSPNVRTDTTDSSTRTAATA